MSAPHPGSDDRRVLLALLLVQLFFGIQYVVAKLVLQMMEPGAWATVRILAAAAILQLWVLWRVREYPRRAVEWLLLTGFAACGVVVNQVCFVEGLSRTTPAHSALINTTIPVWTFLFAVLLRREPLRRARLAGLLIALAGVWVLLRADRFRLEQDLLAGDLLTLTNAVSYGLFLVVSKRYLATHDPLATIAHVFSVGAVGITLYGWSSVAAVDVGQLPPRFYAYAAFIILIPTVGAYFLVYWALRRTHSTLVALFIYIQPVVAMLLDAALLGRWPGWRYYPAALLVFLGVGLGIRSPAAFRIALPGRPGNRSPPSD